jgi:hypothetical protein
MPSERPRDLSPGELGFQRQSPVPWLSPPLLAATAIRVVLAELFGAYLDKRELQAVMAGAEYRYDDGDELWIDYVADAGDGFNATYTMAYLAAQPTLTVERPDGSAFDLPRGRVLVLGGDQVYPVPSAKEYENRWKGPYRAALPSTDGDATTIYALPGNHDWYDGLTAFLRIFAQGDPIGGWRTQQARSYFALALPHGWWLFGIDAQFDAYLDEPQLRYFRAAASRLRPGDRVILCAARPTWVIAQRLPDAYNTIDYFIRTVIEPTRATVLAGDAHHYARYSRRERHLITCGGGGAYLMGTAQLPRRIDAPPRRTIAKSASPPTPFALAAAYPSAPTSRRLGWGSFARLPRRNPRFVALLGLLQTFLMLALRTSHGHWVNVPIALMAALVLAGTLAFAMPQPLSHGSVRHVVAGLLHAPPHFALGLAGTWAWSHLPMVDTPRPWNVVLAFVVYAPIVGLLDTWVLCLYLIVASRFDVNVNELFAGQSIEDYKSFLRMHIDRDGSLTIYPLAVERVCRRWRANPAGDAGSPWVVPAEPIRVTMAELAIPVAPDPGRVSGDRMHGAPAG